MNGIAKQFSSIEQVTDQYFPQKSVNNSGKASDICFKDVLLQQQNKADGIDSNLKFSKHAAARLSSRNINLSSEQSRRLERESMNPWFWWILLHLSSMFPIRRWLPQWIRRRQNQMYLPT